MRNLSLEEKIKLLVGKGNFNTNDLDGKIPSLLMSDGPNGCHYPVPLLWLPSIACLASTWSVDMVEKYVHAIADICTLNNVDVLLAPAVNIKKNPLCGRNFEYFSEDPFLTGELAKKYVETLQNRGISSCVKHYLANNREYARLNCSSNVDERTLREIYAKSFEMLMDVEPWSIMCSYNKINGVHASENTFVLKDLLRDQLGYKNVIMSDWGAVHNRDLALKATLDLEMPYPAWINPYEVLKNSLKNGTITEEDIDNSVNRLEAWIDKVVDKRKDRFVNYLDEQRHEIAIETCTEGYVLLKNEDNILPLKNGMSIGIIGSHAQRPELSGGGSCNLADDPQLNPNGQFNIKQKPLIDLLKERFKDSNLDYADGYCYHEGFGMSYSIFIPLQIKNVASNKDAVIVVVGTNRRIECEGYDREDLKLPKLQLDVLLRATEYSDNVIVIIESGGVIDVSSFKDKVKAIIYAPFGGEATNEALARILTGEVNPSGKLTESFIKDVSVNPYIHEPNMDDEEYDDRIYVGYRLYETKNIPVEYPFGHGLSYTKFKYDNLSTKKIDTNTFEVSCDITNIGECFGKEVVQLYINGSLAFSDRPIKELVGFTKISLEPKETQKITFKLTQKSFVFFDENKHEWTLKNGKYAVYVASSSKDVQLEAPIDID